MPSLNHVYMWVDNQWKPVKAEEIAKTHPGKISANSGLLMCELCGQIVGMAHGKKNVPHFRHRSKEQDKECKDRALSLKLEISSCYHQHYLPLRMKLNSGIVSFEIGLIKVPSQYLSNDSFVEILSDNKTESFRYNSERLLPDAVNYLYVGKNPSRQYSIKVHNASKDIELYWPSNVAGINLEGTMFDAESGKKLPVDADVVINKAYYLLTCNRIYTIYSDVDIREIYRNYKNGQYIRVYRVEAKAFSKESARFFLDNHCRLTERPVKIQPIWPVYAESPYLIKHNRNEMYIHIAGEAGLYLFPTAYSHGFPCSNGKITEITVNSKQQFISVGRTNVLKYKYFWQEPIQKPLPQQTVNIVDKRNNAFGSGVIDRLPEDQIIRCTLPYDGTIIIKEKGIIKEKRSVKADEQTTINNINWGTSVTVFLGLDLVWEASFEKTISVSQDEDELLYQLRLCSGNMVNVPHSIGNLVHRFKDYPKVRQWIYQCVRQGRMSDKALKMLKSYIVNGRNEQNEGSYIQAE